MKRLIVLLLLFFIVGMDYAYAEKTRKNIFERSMGGSKSTDQNGALRRTYPFKGMSMEQIRRTKEYEIVRKAYGKKFFTGPLLRGASPALSGETDAPHEMIGPAYRKAKKALLAKPVTDGNFKALYAFTVLCRQKQALLANQRNDLKYCLIYVDNRIATNILLHACETLPDGELRKACVDAYIDSTDIVRQCKLSLIWEKALSSTKKKSGPRLGIADDPSAWLASMAIERGKAYNSILEKTKDPYIKTALNLDTLQKTTAEELAKRRRSVDASTRTPKRTTQTGNPPAGRGSETKAGSTAAKPDGKNPLPAYQTALRGSNPVRVRNPNDFSVSVGIRAGTKGRDFKVSANGVSTVYVPDGKYEIYFVYSTKPDALFQGDGFTLRGNGIEIRIVKVVGGNYNIRQVK